jgi:guanine nucleotide-binding protein G(i) subunit alpha
LSRICSINYIPEIDDLLRVRQPTTAISEYKFKISGTYFLFVDVGGQRSERRKWINCFENVTSLLFVASLSDYDSILSIEELKSTGDTIRIVNRMKESIDLFHTLINWKKKTYLNKDKSDIIQTVKETFLFDKVSIILFLNKEDLFIEKFRFSSIKECFEDYQENDSIDKAKEFIANKFIENGNSCDFL